MDSFAATAARSNLACPLPASFDETVSKLGRGLLDRLDTLWDMMLTQNAIETFVIRPALFRSAEPKIGQDS